MGSSFQGLDDANCERPCPVCSRVLLLIGHQLESHNKFEFSHAVVSGVVGPHGCEYLTNGAEVFLDRSLIDGFPLCRQKAGTDVLGENLEERGVVFDALEVRGDVHPAAETPPLVPGGGVFIE